MIHKEGRKLLLITFIILIIINWLLFYFSDPIIFLIIGLGSLSLFIFLLQFFRNPTRAILINENQIISPADGKVVVIEETVESEFFNDKRRQVSIFMSPFNVHVNRFPIAGLVSYFKYHPGKFLVAWNPKSSTENERTSLVIQHSNGTSILVRQIAGIVARRIRWYIKEGDKKNQGEEFGFIKFGSRVDLFLPLDTKINVSLNQKVKGGKTIIASF